MKKNYWGNSTLEIGQDLNNTISKTMANSIWKNNIKISILLFLLFIISGLFTFYWFLNNTWFSICSLYFACIVYLYGIQFIISLILLIVRIFQHKSNQHSLLSFITMILLSGISFMIYMFCIFITWPFN